MGDVPITDDLIKNPDFKEIASLQSLYRRCRCKSVPNMKKYSITPPRGSKGWGGIKRSFVTGEH